MNLVPDEPGDDEHCPEFDFIGILSDNLRFGKRQEREG
jgi:hypothetical protein